MVYWIALGMLLAMVVAMVVAVWRICVAFDKNAKGWW